MKVLFLVNPTTGGKSNPLNVEIAERHFSDAGWAADTVRSKSPDHAAGLIQSARGNGYELLVLAGGDGTVHHAIQHLPLGTRDEPSALPFAIFPLGSGNDVYRGTGAPRDPDGAAENIVKGKPVTIDIGIVEPINDDGTPRDEPAVRFINTAGVGIDSQTLATREKSPKWLCARYDLLFILTLMKLYPLEVTLETDDWDLRTDAYWILCCNNAYIGGGMHVAPGAKIDDGIFDVLIVEKMPKIKFLLSLPKVFKGTHLDMDGIEIRHARNIILRCHPDQRLATDGDHACPAPVRITMLPGAVSLWTSPHIFSSGFSI